MGLGIYIHIPFCRKKCYYCDFPSFAGYETLMEPYGTALSMEIEEKSLLLEQLGPADTVYIGGGTPTALPLGVLARLIGKLRRTVPIKSDAEITIEANPGTVDEEYLHALLECGVNRLSMGVQSFNDTILRAIGRIHTAEQAVRAVEMAKSAGFKNLSLDLMYGLPGQGLEDLKTSVETAMELAPQHISIYGLQVEDGTLFARQQEKGELRLPVDDIVEAMYDYMTEYLPDRGYVRYEISNFALPGYESRHNMGYWTDVPYLGMGAAAHSYMGDSRWNNVSSVEKYIKSVETGLPYRENEELLDRETEMEEFCFLALRMSAGIDKRAFQRKFDCPIGSVYNEAIEKMKARKLLEETEDHIRLTSLGMKFGNVVFREFVF
ncbi:MAG TPA: coproporphyrinogen dehydrogenase [Selenomonas sp.]|nr:coproporphyrinogen dehydrogenase [Selenomonas sp.]